MGILVLQGRCELTAFICLFCGLIFLNLGCGEGKPKQPDDIDNANATPIADAGPDRSSVVGTLLNLSAAGSSDIEGSTLTYHWFIVEKPVNSQLSLNNDSARDIDVITDAPGLYVLQLHVNDGELTSNPDQLIIRATNSKPVAKPIYSGNPLVGATIALDGGLSYDGDNHPLTFHWEIISKPANSFAEVQSAVAKKTQFTIDQAGTYVIHLVVNDGYEESQTTIFTIPVEGTFVGVNLPPVAEAGDDVALAAPRRVELDGSGSFDPNNEPLQFRWEILTKPPSSNATLDAPSSEKTGFTADVMGNYVFKLTVSDAAGLNHFDTVVVTPKTGGLYCLDCHNGKIATDDSTHPPEFDYYSDCNRCHGIAQWYMGKNIPKSFYESIINKHSVNLDPNRVHNGIVAGCSNCHEKLPQQAFNEHPNTSSRCNACHTVWTWKTNILLEHTRALGPCKNCHSQPSDANHETVTAQCNYCHSRTDWKVLLPKKAHDFDDIFICYNCHISYSDKYETEIHGGISDLCEHCHFPLGWTNDFWFFFDHRQYTNNCFVCHNGSFTTGQQPSHIPTSKLCFACHNNTGTFIPPFTVDHTQTKGSCASCHTGNPLPIRGPNHPNTTDNCGACHNTEKWVPIDQLDQSQVLP